MRDERLRQGRLLKIEPNIDFGRIFLTKNRIAIRDLGLRYNKSTINQAQYRIPMITKCKNSRPLRAFYTFFSAGI